MSSCLSPYIENADTIRARACGNCPLCGEAGQLRYEGLSDRLFGAPGCWGLRQCAASRCRLLWLDPMPVEEDLWKAYVSYYTHTERAAAGGPLRRLYARMRGSYLGRQFGYASGRKGVVDGLLGILALLNPVRRESFDFSAFYLQAVPGGRLLELGCGTGAMLKEMEDLGWHVEGIDFDPSAVTQARSKGLTVHLGSLAEQKFRENQFDAVAASHFIEHASDPVGVLKECRRILKPGGSLVQITPNAASWGHRLYRSDWRGLEVPRHLQVFTPAALEDACRRVGLEVRSCRSSVRANGILRASSLLRKTGTADPGLKPTFGNRLWEELRSLVQFAALPFDREAGEEIVLIAAK